MKTLTLLLSIVLCCPLALFGQSAAVLLEKVAEALASGNDEYAVSLFRQSAVADAEQTEMFYWTHVNKNAAVTPRLAQELAVRYKKSGITIKPIFSIGKCCRRILRMCPLLCRVPRCS